MNAVAGSRLSFQSPLRKMLLACGLQLTSLLLAALAGEVALRIVFARSLDFSMEMWKYGVQLKLLVENPQLGFAHSPNRSAFLMGVPVSINSMGYRDREYAQSKPPGVYRIVMLGDSTTFGWGVPVDQTTAKILERQLNQESADHHFEVINAGVGNYNTVQELAHYLTYDRVLHPNLVILQYFINDAEPVPATGRAPLLARSYLCAFVVSRFDAVMRLAGKRPDWKAYYAGLYREDNPGLKAAEDALVKLAAATRQDGAALLVTILPELREINNDYPFTKEHQTIKTVLTANQIGVIDLIDGLRGHGPESGLWVTRADDHPNGKANALVAAQVLPWIRQTAGLH